MGATPANGFGHPGFQSQSAFYGGENTPKPKQAPGAGGRPAVPGGPRLPNNPYAEHAWRQQYMGGAMNQPRIRFPKYIQKV